MEMADNDDPGVPDLSPPGPFNPVFLAANVKLQRPLSRRSKGPGLLIFLPDQDHRTQQARKTLDPVPLQKWAEEGFAVVEVTIDGAGSLPARDVLNVEDACERAVEALTASPDCMSDGHVGVIGR
jgi:carboxymethylenebutenolidase